MGDELRLELAGHQIESWGLVEFPQFDYIWINF